MQACYCNCVKGIHNIIIEEEKMLNLIYSSLLSVLLLSTSFAGEAMNSAQENEKELNYYISLSHGKSLYDVSDRIFNTVNSHFSDKQDKSTKITFGKVISNDISFELSYMNAGQANLQTVFGGTINYSTQRTSTLDLDLVYQFASIYNTQFYVKAGPSYAMTSSHNIRTPESDFTMFKEVVNDREFILHTGFGMEKKIVGHTIIIEYDKYHSLNSGGNFMLTNTVSANSTQSRALEGDIETLMIGLKFNF